MRSIRIKMFNFVFKETRIIPMIPYSNLEFKVKALTKGAAFDDVFVLVLMEKGGNTIFPLPVDAQQKELLYAMMNQQHTYDFLLESFRTITATAGTIFEGICITRVEDGDFKAEVYLNQNGEDLVSEMSAGNAVILALSYRSPIYVKASLLQETMVGNHGSSFSFSLNSLGKSLLQKALEDAVEREQYEIASLLRDELKKRG